MSVLVPTKQRHWGSCTRIPSTGSNPQNSASTLPANSAATVLARLYEKDAIGKTADGYYHALDDSVVAQYADRLNDGDRFPMDTGKEEYPDNINETTTGFPEEGAEMRSLIKDDAADSQTESCPDDE